MRKWLIDLREEKGYSSERMAEELGISPRDYRNIESGNTPQLDDSIMSKLSMIFLRGLGWLVELENSYLAEDDGEIDEIKNVCWSSAEEIDSLRETLAVARMSFPPDLRCSELCLIQTVEVALMQISRDLASV